MIPTNHFSLDWTTTDSGLESERFIVGPKPTKETLTACYEAMKQTSRGESSLTVGTEPNTVVGLWEKEQASGDRSYLGAVYFGDGIGLGRAGKSNAHMGIMFSPFKGITNSERESLIKAAIMWFLKNSTCTAISWDIPRTR